MEHYYFNPDEEYDDDFWEFVQEVRDDFEDNQDAYLDMVQDILPEAITVNLIGSYGPDGSPTPDSDVDMEVVYAGILEPEDVYEMLKGQIYGPGGTFDIIPTRIETNPNFYWSY